MSETPNYFTKLIKEQLVLLAERIPNEEEEIIISRRRIRLRKNNRERDLELSSPPNDDKIEEYMAEFRGPIREVTLPTVEGDEMERTKKILKKLKLQVHHRAFEYHYLLGKLLRDYPTIVKPEITKEYGRFQGLKLMNMLQKTVTLFDAIGISYMTIKKLTPSKLEKMNQKTFDKLMTRVSTLVAERRVASSLAIEDILADYDSFDVSQELNTGAGVMLPEFEFDPNSTINDPEFPE